MLHYVTHTLRLNYTVDMAAIIKTFLSPILYGGGVNLLPFLEFFAILGMKGSKAMGQMGIEIQMVILSKRIEAQKNFLGRAIGRRSRVENRVI